MNGHTALKRASVARLCERRGDSSKDGHGGGEESDTGEHFSAYCEETECRCGRVIQVSCWNED